MYTKAELLNLKPNVYITKIGTGICNYINNLKVKQNFRRKRGGKKICSRIWNNNNGIHHNVLWSLNRSDKTFWNLAKLKMALVTMQSLKPKLDILIHHTQLNNIDMCFVMETWTQHDNKPEYQYIKANLDIPGYKIPIQSRKKTEKDEELQ